MATASTPARCRCPSEEVAANASRPPSQASAHLDATVRFPPLKAFRLYGSSDARDSISLTSAARRIAAAGALLSAPTPQSPSPAALRQSQNSSPAERRVYRQAHRSRRFSPFPTRTHSSRFSARVGPAAEEVFANVVADLADQINAQSAAQIAACSALTQQLAEMPAALQQSQLTPSHPPSRCASPTSSRPPSRQTVMDKRAPPGVPLRLTARSLALVSHAAADVLLGAAQQAHKLSLFARDASHVQLVAFQQAHQLAPPARIASPVPLGAAQQLHQLTSFPLAPYPLVSPAPFALTTLSSNFAESPQSGLLLAPLALSPLSVASLPSHLQYALQYSQSAPCVASTVVVPAALQPGTTSALYAPAPRLSEAAAVQPALQVGAQFAMCDQPLQVGATLVMGAQPSQGGAQYAAYAQLVAQVKAPFAVCAQLATPAGAQPRALASD